MRRVKYFVASSLDGYISRLDGGIDWLFPVSKEQDYGMAAFLASVDLAVMGQLPAVLHRPRAGRLPREAMKAAAQGLKTKVRSAIHTTSTTAAP